MSSERPCAPTVRTLFTAKALNHGNAKRPEVMSLLVASMPPSSAGRLEP